MSTEIQHYEQDTSLVQFRAPEQVLAEAKKAAEALTKVIGMKSKKVMFNGEQYLEFEDWQTVGKFYGCTAKTINTTFVTYGDVQGFEATAVVLDSRGNVITQADAMCLNDEENWGLVAKYEWQPNPNGGKNIKVKVADVPKPLFQLRSMAQTRACARALRQVFAWVVVLAGYKPSVAEEMIEGQDLNHQEEQKKPVDMPKSTEQKSALETVSGTVVSVRPGKDDKVQWVNLGDAGVLLIAAERFTPAIIPGAKVQAQAVKRTMKTGSPYYDVQSITVAAAETVKEEPKQESTPESRQKAEAAQKAAEDVITGEYEDMPAEEEKPKTIGAKRAQSLHITRSTNQKNTGLTEEILHKMMAGLEPPIEHLRDLPVGLETTFRKYMSGEDSGWRELV